MKKLFKKYAVVCYIVHAGTVAYCDVFRSFKRAKKSLKDTIAYNYEQEKEYADKMGYEVCFGFKGKNDEHAFIKRYTQDGLWYWTWDIEECNRTDWTFLDDLIERFCNFIDKIKNANN